MNARSTTNINYVQAWSIRSCISISKNTKLWWNGVDYFFVWQSLEIQQVRNSGWKHRIRIKTWHSKWNSYLFFFNMHTHETLQSSLLKKVGLTPSIWLLYNSGFKANLNSLVSCMSWGLPRLTISMSIWSFYWLSHIWNEVCTWRWQNGQISYRINWYIYAKRNFNVQIQASAHECAKKKKRKKWDVSLPVYNGPVVSRKLEYC